MQQVTPKVSRNLSFPRNYLRQRLPLEILKHWRAILRDRLMRKVKMTYCSTPEQSSHSLASIQRRIEFAPAHKLLVQDVVHLAKLPDAIQKCLGEFDIPSSYVLEAHNVELVGSQAIGFEQNTIIGETTLPSYYPDNTGITARTLIARHFPFKRSLKTPIAQCLLNVWSNNYYHWLIDCLTRLEGIQFYQNTTGCRPKLLLQSEPKRWQLESLSLLGYRDEDYFYWTQQRSQVEKLIVPSHRYDALNTVSPNACFWLRQAILKGLQNVAIGDWEHSPRILISRSKAAGRKVLNEEEVIATLAPLGFKVYHLEDLSFTEQVHLFSRAEVVVAPHGAGLTNIIFSKNLKVVELFGDPIAPVFCTLAKALGFEYAFLQCASTDNHHNPTKNNLVVKIANLQLILQQIGIH